MIEISGARYAVEKGSLVQHRDAIVSLWKNGLYHSFPDAAYKWLFLDNPQGEAEVFLLEKESSGEMENVGVLCASPRNWKIKGQSTRIMLFSDLVVKPTFRSLRPAAKLVELASDTVIDRGITSIGFPNKLATPVLKRLGYRIVGDFSRYGKVLRSRKKLLPYIPGWLSYLAAPVVDAALWLDDLVNRVRTGSSRLGESGWQESFNERFDELAENASMSEIYNVRNREFLQWRFGQCPEGQFKVFTVNERGSDRLAGYAVCHFKENLVLIEDFYARDMDEYAPQVLACLIRELRKFKVDSISMVLLAHSKFMKLLDRNRFRKRQEFRHMFIRATDPFLIQHEDLRELIYLTVCDEDQ